MIARALAPGDTGVAYQRTAARPKSAVIRPARRSENSNCPGASCSTMPLAVYAVFSSVSISGGSVGGRFRLDLDGAFLGWRATAFAGERFHPSWCTGSHALYEHLLLVAHQAETEGRSGAGGLQYASRCFEGFPARLTSNAATAAQAGLRFRHWAGELTRALLAPWRRPVCRRAAAEA